MTHLENNQLLKQRHSLAHILAQAVQREQQADVEVGIGPSIDNGFYYDFLFSADKQIKEEDLQRIQKQMEKIVKENQDFIVINCNDKDSKELVTKIMKQKYKEEMRSEFISLWESITFYVNTIHAWAKDKVLAWIDIEYLKYYEKVTEFLQKKYPEQFENKFVTFLDMCEWPHVENTKEILFWSFTLEKLAGAYRRWSEKNVMMTRIYGLAFESKDELKKYQTMMEEAKKRDHRVLGQKLDLFHIDDKVWLGLPLRHPKWAMLWRVIEDFWYQEHIKWWYDLVRSPHIGNKALRETSWHRGFYNESMYPPLEVGQTLKEMQENKKTTESESYLIKPMNCPFHVQIYKDSPKSYRDFPFRRAECGTVYRFEKKWQLSWLTRVRWFTQDDAHIFCRKDQVEDELKRVIDFILFIYKSFGFNIEDVQVFLSMRDPNNKEKYAWNDEGRDFTQKVLEKVAIEKKLNYTKEEWEAAFYGPKLDFKIKDVLWRLRQCSTLQFDFNLPNRFDLEFTNNNWEKEKPYMLHRALFGSFERFIWLLIEHYAGAFPLWLAPVQMQIVPVAEKFNDYADKILEKLKSESFRVKIDDSADSFSKKIRNAELIKVPYILIVGEKEETDGTVSVRNFRTKEQSVISLENFVSEKVEERKCRRI